MKAKLIFASLFLSMAGLSAQTYQVPVSEQDEPMMKGKFEPTWSSLENYQVPEWFRNVKFGIWAIGGRSVWKVQATGWLVPCTWRVLVNMNIM